MATSRTQSPMLFFGLVYLLSIPFWVIGALSARQLLPALPVSALAFLCPVTAAVILVYRERGRAGVVALLKRSFDFGRSGSKIWLAPLLLLEPGIMILSYGVMRLTGSPVPVPQFNLLTALALGAVFFIAGLGEELGWSGYATDPLQERFGALKASLIIGLVWAAWHFIGLTQAHRSPEFIAWWMVSTLGYRVIIVWLYNNMGRSVFAAAVFHALINLTWQLFPVDGSFYDPRVTGLIAAVTAVGVVILWGPRTLTRQNARLQRQPD